MEASVPQPFSTWGALRGSWLAGHPHPVRDLGVGVSHGQRHPGGQDAGSALVSTPGPQVLALPPEAMPQSCQKPAPHESPMKGGGFQCLTVDQAPTWASTEAGQV